MKTESVKGSSEGTIRNTPLAQALAAHRKSASFMEGDYGIGYVTIKKAHTILLGQTKYYYAVDDPNNPGKVIIKESLVPANGRTDAVFSPPQIVSGDRVGVYWGYRDSNGNDLKTSEPGSIRLVGWYWEEGKTYKVKLSATAGGRTGSIDIEVKRPRALLTPGQSYSYDPALDVFNAHISIDSLCIKWGGQYGIPPQFLKGQIYQEAEKTDHSFWPTYRYEPWRDLSFRKNKNSAYYMSQPYWVMGVGTATSCANANVRKRCGARTGTRMKKLGR